MNILSGREGEGCHASGKGYQVINANGHLIKIISGGQTGVDRAALDWAIEHNIDHGGWCPLNRHANDGPLASLYRLRETKSTGYSQRTRRNVQDADATLILIRGQLVGGSRLTKRIADELNKPVHVANLELDCHAQVEQVQSWLSMMPIGTLNIAGPSEERCDGIYHQVKEFLNKLCDLYQ